MLATPETVVRTEAPPRLATPPTGSKSARHARKRPAAAEEVDPRERAMRRLLSEDVPTGPGHLDLGCCPPRRKLSCDEASFRRSAGVRAILEARRVIKPGARTVALAVHLWDKLLAKTCEVEAASSAPSSQHDDGVPATAHPASLKADGQAVATSPVLGTGSPIDGLEFPCACFVIACKIVETFAPRLVDIATISGGECTAQQIRDAESVILSLLSWNVSNVTGSCC